MWWPPKKQLKGQPPQADSPYKTLPGWVAELPGRVRGRQCLLSAVYCVRKQRSVYAGAGAGWRVRVAGRAMQGQGCQLRLTSVSGTIASGSNVIMRTQGETRSHFHKENTFTFYDT